MQPIKSDAHARSVKLEGMSPEAAKETLEKVGDLDAAAMKEGVPKFAEVTLYSFRAEYTLIEDNIIIHFFVPKRAEPYIKGDNNPAEQKWMEYWVKVFPAKLDSLARKYFDAEYPRLQAKYTPEVASWWFKAQGFSSLINPLEFTRQFLVKLDAALRGSS